MKKVLTEKNITDIQPLDGFTQIESVIFAENNFLNTQEVYRNFKDLYEKSWLDKFLISEISSIKGAEEFLNFISNNKDKIYCIVGDYDADGLMATTIMKIALDKYGVKECHYIIPDRLNDGYGIKIKHIDKALTLNADIIITVDNGITANDVVDYAKEKGLSVLITDHHIPTKDNLPKADLLINPHLSDEVFEPICGAMVALKLAIKLLNINIKENLYILKDCAVFAAVATISDVMPLINENRQLVKYVLDNVNYYKNKNIWSGRMLKFLSGFGASRRLLNDPDLLITEDTFAFYIGPTINASGRVNGETENIIKAIVDSANYGNFISGFKEINRERQEKTREIFKEHLPNNDPIGFIEIDADKYEYPIGGLTGLVANRIADKDQKPAFIGTEKDGKISFSCRSVPGYSLYEGLGRFFKKYPDTTVEGGGHDGAIGIRTSNQEEVQLLKEHFSEDFMKYAQLIQENVYRFEPQYLDQIFDAHYCLAPFGKGFTKLKFVYTGTVKNYISETKELFIDDMTFKTFISDPKLLKIGQTVRVIFTTMTESNLFNLFKIEEIEVI